MGSYLQAYVEDMIVNMFLGMYLFSINDYTQPTFTYMKDIGISLCVSGNLDSFFGQAWPVSSNMQSNFF